MQLLYPRTKEHHGRGDGKIVRARGPRHLIRWRLLERTTTGQSTEK
ncbi:hypothetical protein LEMLEM_LOCUS18060, partial [Lemmus lemmus]